MSIELEDTRRSDLPDNSEEDGAAEVEGLPPVDGAAAWRFLVAATMVEAVLWAFPLAFGVFQNYYSNLPEFYGDQNIPVIGVLPTSVFFLGALFVTPLIQKYPRWQRPMIPAGLLTCVAALLGASFANSVRDLIITQGLLFGCGFLLLYVPLISMMNEWFVRHRGLAFGILYAGAGASGIVYPFILQASLTRWGYRTTLRACAIGQGCLIGAMIPLLKGRVPASRSSGSFRRIDASFLRKPLFYVYALSNLCQSIAFYMPGLWLPSFASLLGYSQAQGALLLALNNVAQVLGQVAFGAISDRSDNVLGLVFASSFMSAVAVFTLWGLARTLAPLVVFALVYGLFAGGYVVLWPRFGTALVEDPRTVYNLMAFEKGIGNIASGPLSARLLNRPIALGYGMGKYETLIIFMGSFMFASSLGVLGWPLKKRREMI